MATNIPPHNLGELVDSLSALIRNPNATVRAVLHLISTKPYFFSYLRCVFLFRSSSCAQMGSNKYPNNPNPRVTI